MKQTRRIKDYQSRQKKWNDSILVPLLGRGVFTAGFAPPRPFPTPTYKCVGGSRPRESRLVARRRLASSSSLCQEAMNFSAPCNTPLCHGAPSSIFAARVHTALSVFSENITRKNIIREKKARMLPAEEYFGSNIPGDRSSI